MIKVRNIVLARIDERLIHGQVATAWISYVNCNTLYVIDDATAKNAMLSKVIVSIAPKGIVTEVMDASRALEVLAQPSPQNEKLMLIAKTPGVFEELVNAGVGPQAVNLGGMGLNRNRKPFYENASASEEEVASMARMIEKGVKVFYQVTPFTKSVDVQKLINK